MNKHSLSAEARRKTILSIVLGVICVIYVLPVLTVVINSFKLNTYVKTDTFALPNAESFAGWANFIKGLTFGNYPFLKSAGYSLFITIVSTALILLCCLTFPKEALCVPEAVVTLEPRRAAAYGLLFCLAVAMVLRAVPYQTGLLIIVASLLILDRHALKTVDWGLLATFAAFFTFSGNMARIETVRVFFQQLLAHSAMLVSALTSQIISNVPAAILLSRFTDDYRGLLVGVNVGGAGTLVASLASLITFCEYTKRLPQESGRFLLRFSAVSFALLAILLAAMALLGC